MDDLERELLNYNDMGTSIEKIKNPGMNSLAFQSDSKGSGIENRELFRDLNTFSSDKNPNESCQSCNVGNKNFNVNNFVQELENNLDNFDNAEENIGPSAANQDFNNVKEDFTEKLINFEDEKEDSDTSEEEPEEAYENWNNKIYNLLVNIKEPLIVVLLFILLNNREFITLTYRLPFINNFESPYPSLVIRGIILAAVIFYLRKL
jgi:hypothetical protein